MKSLLTKSIRRVGQGVPVWLSLLVLAFTPFAGKGQQLYYINRGILLTNNPPQVDAVNFVNYGTIGTEISPMLSIDPITTSDTLNFTNAPSYPGSGTMVAAPGWKFDWEPNQAGSVHWASSFYNANEGLVEAQDSQNFSYYIGIPQPSSLNPSKLFISATNIINYGALVVGANGWLQLNGDHVDLSRSVVSTTAVSSEATGSSGTTTNFFPDVAVSDLLWAQTNMDFDTTSLWNGTNGYTARTPVFNVTEPLTGIVIGFQPSYQFTLFNPLADAYTNNVGVLVVTITNQDASTTVVNLITNAYKQAVFVGVPNGMSASDGFVPSSTPFTNHFQSINLLLSMSVSNPITLGSDQANIYIHDELAGENTRGLAQNQITFNTFRPANYTVSRIQQGRLGVAGNYGYPFDPKFFYDSGNTDTNILTETVTNTIVQGYPYAGYGAGFDNVVSEPTASPGGTVTNLPGRVRIYANNLDLTKTRIRGEGQVIVQATHLVSSTNTVIDCQNLSFDLASTNGNLKFQSLAGSGVQRLTGPVYLWSAVWSNSMVVVLNNYAISNNVSTNGSGVTVTNPVAVLSPLTNNVTVSYHTLMADATAVHTAVPVTVYDLLLRSTNAVVNDTMTLVESLYADSQSLTLNGGLTFSSATLQNPFGLSQTVSLNNWISTNTPNLLYFTNNGSLSIPGEAHFGDDRVVPFSDFINNGTINAATLNFNSAYFENSGTLGAAGSLSIAGGAGKFVNGSTTAGGVGWLSCNSLKFNGYSMSFSGPAYFSVTNALYDTGAGSGNSFQFQDGFSLLMKPPVGDLLGTVFHSVAPNLISPSIRIDHYWAGEDRGTNVAGYLNNEAIGQLVLSASSPDPLFVFSGTSAQNGLYIDLLDISALTDYTNQIRINPNLVIYYAAAKINASVALPANTGPEEYLNGQFGGHLRWVPCFAGPNSSTAVVIGTPTGLQSIKVNTALRNSKIIDSDGDGYANYYDAYPFNANTHLFSVTPVPPALMACNVLAPGAKTFVSITSPVPGDSVTSTSALVQGTAGTANGSLAYVFYQVNNGGWMPAATDSGGAAWSGPVALSPGNNVVQAYAQDALGNTSPVQSVSFSLAPTAPITVLVNGGGMVISNYNGQFLALNHTYTMTAYPSNGFAFSNWTGSVVSKNPQLTFLMKSNLSFTANFVPQPFTPAVAAYSGLFYQDTGVHFLKSGGVSITTAKSGTYSGNLQFGGKTYPFTGKFNALGAGSATNKNGGLVVSLQMNIADNSSITGMVTTAAWTASLQAVRATAGAYVGNYTFVIPGSGDITDTNTPFGTSYATATVKPGGTMQSTVFLADGTPQFTVSAAVSQDGRTPLYQPLYQGQGQLLGWLTLTNTEEADLKGWASWYRPAVAGAKYYPAGFNLEEQSVTGSAYVPTNAPLTIFTNAALQLNGGNLPAGISNRVAVAANNNVSNLSSNKLMLTLTKPTGLFGGSVNPTNSKAAIKFNGVILQKQQMGAGYFLGTNQSGRVSFSP